MFGRLFSFDGRLARLQFFLRDIQVNLIAVVIFFASLPFFMDGGRALWWAGILVVALAGVVLVVATVSLTVRRLHDLGLSGYHAIWVAAADAGAEVLSYGSDKAVLFSLPLAAIGFWLLFWPGSKVVNRFGEVPE